MNSSYIISSSSKKFKVKHNRTNSNIRPYKHSPSLNELNYPTNSFIAFSQVESIPKQNTMSSITTSNMKKCINRACSNLHMYHIRYEFLANKKCNENEISLKHDILVLIGQLKEKEEMLNEMKVLLSKYEENNGNKTVLQQLNEKLFEQGKENKKLQNEIKELNEKVKCNQIVNVHKFDLEKFKECRQYSFNYMIFNSNIKKITKKVKQPYSSNNNINNSINIMKNFTLIDINENKSFLQKTKHNNGTSTFIFKPLIDRKILQYDCINHSYTLITPIDYSNFYKNFSIHGSKYITINNILYIISGIQYNILYSFNPISNALLKIITLEHNHKHCGLIQYQKNILAIIGGEISNEIELYDITLRKLHKEININIPNIPYFIQNCSFNLMNKGEIICYGEFNDNQINNCCLIYKPANKKWESLKLNFLMKSCLLFKSNNGMVYSYTIDGKIFQINVENGNVELIKDNMNGVINRKELSFDMVPKEIGINGKSFACFFDKDNNVYKISLSDFELECDYY